jgi:nitrogen PTS system EIIA component
MKIAEFLRPEAVLVDLSAKTKPEMLKELSFALSQGNPLLKPESLVAVLSERERLGSTGIGEGVAIPHGKLAGIAQLYAAFGVSRAGLDFDAIDGKPTYVFFALVAPDNSAGTHLKALARVSRLFKSAHFREVIRQAKTSEEAYRLIVEEDARL